jgi:tetratricopeptide (TPR) repeat protein
MFIHAGWLHLLGNLFILFLAGPPLENRWGRPLFAAFYLLAGLASGAFFVAFSPGSPIPLVGASGAIAAVMGAFFVCCWRTRIHFAYWFFLGFRFLRGTFSAPAPLMLSLWFANELFLAWTTHGLDVQEGLAYSAQVGGFLFGTACALAMRVSHLEERFIHPAIESKLAAKRSPVIEQAMKLRESGELQRARTLLETEIRRHPGDPNAVLAFWDAACALQQAELAAPAMLRLVHKYLAQGKRELAARYWREMSEAAPQVRAEPSVLVRLAPVLLESGQREKAILALEHAVEARDPRLSASLALRVAKLARSLDPGIALRAARCALEAEQLPDPKRDRIEELVATLEVVHANAEGRRSRDDESPPTSDLHEPDTVDLDGAEEVVGFEVPEATPSSGARELPAEFDAASSAVHEEGRELDPAGEPILESPEPGPEPPEPWSSLPRFAGVKVMEAVPVGWKQEGLALQLGGGSHVILAYEKIEALAVAAVNRLSPKPVLVIDLVTNWNDSNEGPLKLVRLRSDGFDPRDFVPSGARPAEALREILARLLAQSRAVPLPDAESAIGRPFQAFEDLETYQREVLQVSS